MYLWKLPEQIEQKRKKSDSRKERLLQLYKQLRMKDVIGQKKLNSVMQATLILKSYFCTTLNKDAVCIRAKKLTSIGDLFTSKYDIDHIYPRSVTKDNSWDNLVLVKAELNREKKDIYPIAKRYTR